jgi:hypothetical protein
LIEPMAATQQYVFLGFNPKKCATPFLFVFSVSNGVPGRGLDVFFGVDSWTGTCGWGVPRIVTKMAALVIDGFGTGEAGDDDGVGVEEPELHAAMASAATARTSKSRLGMSGPLRRAKPRTRFTSARKDESNVVI